MQETLNESLNSFLQKNFHTLNLLKSSFSCLNIFPVGFDTSTILFLLQFFQASLKFLLTVDDVINLSMEITDNQLCLQIDVVIILCPLPIFLLLPILTHHIYCLLFQRCYDLDMLARCFSSLLRLQVLQHLNR